MYDDLSACADHAASRFGTEKASDRPDGAIGALRASAPGSPASGAVDRLEWDDRRRRHGRRILTHPVCRSELMEAEEVVIDEDEWPNCSVPDCDYKSCLPLSDKCYAHAIGKQ